MWHTWSSWHAWKLARSKGYRLLSAHTQFAQSRTSPSSAVDRALDLKTRGFGFDSRAGQPYNYQFSFAWDFNPFPNNNFKILPNSKILRMIILSLMKIAESSPKGVENTAGKGEIARYEQFLLFPQCFQKTFTVDKNQGLFGKGLKTQGCGFDFTVDT